MMGNLYRYITSFIQNYLKTKMSHPAQNDQEPQIQNSERGQGSPLIQNPTDSLNKIEDLDKNKQKVNGTSHQIIDQIKSRVFPEKEIIIEEAIPLSNKRGNLQHSQAQEKGNSVKNFPSILEQIGRKPIDSEPKNSTKTPKKMKITVQKTPLLQKQEFVHEKQLLMDDIPEENTLKNNPPVEEKQGEKVDDENGKMRNNTRSQAETRKTEKPQKIKNRTKSIEYEEGVSKSIENGEQLEEITKLLTKKSQIKKQNFKKLKVNLDDYSEFIPEFLLFLNNQKHKTVIRVGKNYQANVPTSCKYSHIYRPLSQLKLWSKGELNPSVMKKFKEKLGELRTEEDLCLILYQYQCNLNEVFEYMNEYQKELRKSYFQKDRTKY